jgi:hypothetical protein
MLGRFPAENTNLSSKEVKKIRIPNPHVGDISASLIKEILRQANISSEEWDNV